MIEPDAAVALVWEGHLLDLEGRRDEAVARYQIEDALRPQVRAAAPLRYDGAMISEGERLSAIVDTAEPVFRNIRESESERPVLPGGWSHKQLLGHLVDSASNNHQRFVRASLDGPLAFPGYQQDRWSAVQKTHEEGWANLVALWASYNRHLAHVISHLPDERLDVPCRVGANDPVSLRFLVEDYLRHLLHHLRQIGIAAE